MVPNGCCSARRSGKAGPMTSRIDSLPHRRQIIDRRVLADALAALDVADPSALRRAATTHLKQALELGRAEIQRRLIEHPTRGLEAAAAQAFLADQLLRLLYDFVTTRIYPNTNPTAAERIALVAVGGYGRGEMAPFSDIDIARSEEHTSELQSLIRISYSVLCLNKKKQQS